MNKKMISSKGLIKFLSFILLFLLIPSTFWSQSRKGSEGRVYYEGDNVKIQQREKIITIEGNAFIRKETQGLKADKIVWYQNEEYAEAFDNVSFLDREQGVLYKGNYVKFLIEKNIVYVQRDPSIENRKDKITIYANAFEANTKSGSIQARGNTRIFIKKNADKPINTLSTDADYSTANNKIILKKNAVLKTAEQWFSADQIDIDQDNNYVVLERNVRIEDSPEQKQKVQQQNQENNLNQDPNSLGDSILTCNRGKIFTDTKYLECFGDVVLENQSDQSILKSEYFLFDNPKEEILATEKVFFHKKNPTNERRVFSEYMKIYQKSETMYFTNDVVLIDIDSGQTNMQINCYSMRYSYAQESQDEMECFKDVTLYNPQENSYVYSDYFFYRLQTGIGYVEKEPIYLNRQGDKDVYFYSQRMDIDRNQNFVKLNKDVLIVEEERGTHVTNSTVTCNRGEFQYYTVGSNDTFTCYGDIDVYMVFNQTHFYGDQLVYYLQRDYSRLDAEKKVLFNYQKSPANIIQGTADYVENFHERGYSIMSNDVFVTESINGRPVSHLSAQEVYYHFLSQSNAFEGYRDVVYENLNQQSTLYSDYLLYNLNTDIAWAEGQTVLVSRDTEKSVDNLVYADYIQVDNSNNISYLRDRIYIFNSPESAGTPPREPEIPFEQSYLNCQEAAYYFQDEDRIFECTSDMHLVDKENQIDIFSDYMIYNLETEYGFLKEDPYLINARNISNTVYVYSDTMEFFRAEGVSLFHTNVLTKEIETQSDMVRSTVRCDDGKYVFGKVTNTIECFYNVVVDNLIDNYVITGDYLRHQVDEDYSYVSGQGKVVWSEEGNETVVTANLLESFGEENLLYAKGEVKVDNGIHEAESSLGIYEPELKNFTLYGNPLVRDKEGSEFTAEEVYFDIANNKMTLGSEVEGNFIPEGFFE